MSQILKIFKGQPSLIESQVQEYLDKGYEITLIQFSSSEDSMMARYTCAVVFQLPSRKHFYHAKNTMPSSISLYGL